MSGVEDAVQRLLDWHAIHEVLCRYARGCDRGDWELVRSTYHPDAHDDHVAFQGGVDALIEWLAARFDGVDNSVHFLGNCLVEPAGPDVALVETYFISSRVLPSENGGEGTCRQSWGRYVDRFERRAGQWRVSRRKVVLEARFMVPVIGAARSGGSSWGARDASDHVFAERSATGLT